MIMHMPTVHDGGAVSLLPYRHTDRHTHTGRLHSEHLPAHGAHAGILR